MARSEYGPQENGPSLRRLGRQFPLIQEQGGDCQRVVEFCVRHKAIPLAQSAIPSHADVRPIATDETLLERGQLLDVSAQIRSAFAGDGFGLGFRLELL